MIVYYGADRGRRRTTEKGRETEERKKGRSYNVVDLESGDWRRTDMGEVMTPFRDLNIEIRPGEGT